MGRQCSAMCNVLHIKEYFMRQFSLVLKLKILYIRLKRSGWVFMYKFNKKKQLIFRNEYIGNLGERPASDEGVSFVSLF